jgi:uncharacterized protein (TIGR02271 family)
MPQAAHRKIRVAKPVTWVRTATDERIGDDILGKAEHGDAVFRQFFRKRCRRAGVSGAGEAPQTRARRSKRDKPARRSTIERHPVERRHSDQPMDDRGQTIAVPVHEEQVELEKRPVVYEEVGVGKREVAETHGVSGTVRREEARIERDGDVDLDQNR